MYEFTPPPGSRLLTVGRETEERKMNHKIGAYNEWGKLHEVIVGRVEPDTIAAGSYDGMSFFPEEYHQVMKEAAATSFPTSIPRNLSSRRSRWTASDRKSTRLNSSH